MKTFDIQKRDSLTFRFSLIFLPFFLRFHLIKSTQGFYLVHLIKEPTLFIYILKSATSSWHVAESPNDQLGKSTSNSLAKSLSDLIAELPSKLYAESPGGPLAKPTINPLINQPSDPLTRSLQYSTLLVTHLQTRPTKPTRRIHTVIHTRIHTTCLDSPFPNPQKFYDSANTKDNGQVRSLSRS